MKLLVAVLPRLLADIQVAVVVHVLVLVAVQPGTSWGNASSCRTAWTEALPDAFSSDSARQHPRCAEDSLSGIFVPAVTFCTLLMVGTGGCITRR